MRFLRKINQIYFSIIFSIISDLNLQAQSKHSE